MIRPNNVPILLMVIDGRYDSVILIEYFDEDLGGSGMRLLKIKD